MSGFACSVILFRRSKQFQKFQWFYLELWWNHKPSHLHSIRYHERGPSSKCFEEEFLLDKEPLKSEKNVKRNNLHLIILFKFLTPFFSCALQKLTTTTTRTQTVSTKTKDPTPASITDTALTVTPLASTEPSTAHATTWKDQTMAPSTPNFDEWFVSLFRVMYY